MTTRESVQFARRYAPAVFNGLLATACTVYAVVIFRVIQSLNPGDTGTAVGIASFVLLILAGLDAGFWLLTVAYGYLARYDVTEPHVGYDIGTASAPVFVLGFTLLFFTRELGLVVGMLALIGEVVELSVVYLTSEP